MSCHPQEANLQLLEDNVKVECQVVALISGPQALAPALASILKALPTSDKETKPESCLQLLTTLRSTPTWKLTPNSVQSLLNWTIKQVTNLVDGNPYVISKSTTTANAGALGNNCHWIE